MSSLHIDAFSGSAADLPRGRRTMENLLHAFASDPLVSCWDMSEQAWLRNLVRDATEQGLLTSGSQPYPWCRYELTDAGRAAGAGKEGA